MSQPATRPSTVARDPRIDALRAMAILAVVLGHAITAVEGVYVAVPGYVSVDPGFFVPLQVAMNVLLSAVYTFHVPLFAFVSGLVLWRPVVAPFAAQVRRRAVGLLVPYFAWFCVFELQARILHRREAAPGFLDNLASVAINPTNPHALWFLYSLFFCAVLVAAISHLPNGERMVLWLVPIVIAIEMVPGAREVHLFGIAKFLWIFPFFAAGYSIAPVRSRIERRWVTVALVAGALFAVLAWVRYPVHVWSASLLHVLTNAVSARLHTIPGGSNFTHVVPALVRYGCAFSACFMALALYTRGAGPLLRFQAWIGRKALGIYAIHGLVVLGLVQYVHVRSWPLVFVIGLSLSIAAIIVLERIPIVGGVLLGKGWMRARSAAVPSERPPGEPERL